MPSLKMTVCLTLILLAAIILSSCNDDNVQRFDRSTGSAIPLACNDLSSVQDMPYSVISSADMRAMAKQTEKGKYIQDKTWILGWWKGPLHCKTDGSPQGYGYINGDQPQYGQALSLEHEQCHELMCRTTGSSNWHR